MKTFFSRSCSENSPNNTSSTSLRVRVLFLSQMEKKMGHLKATLDPFIFSLIDEPSSTLIICDKNKW